MSRQWSKLSISRALQISSAACLLPSLFALYLLLPGAPTTLALFCTLLFGAIFISYLVLRQIKAEISATQYVSACFENGEIQQAKEAIKNANVLPELKSTLENKIAHFEHLLDEIRKLGIEVTTASTYISAETNQLDSWTREQSAFLHEFSSKVSNIASTSSIAASTASSLKTALTAAEEATSGVEQLCQMSKDYSKCISNLQEQLQSVSDSFSLSEGISNTLIEVADRSNMLSLNAAIEAEKAGQHGRGLTVVAQEIKRLAQETAATSLDLENLASSTKSSLETLQACVNALVELSSAKRGNSNEERNDACALSSKLQQLPPLLSEAQNEIEKLKAANNLHSLFDRSTSIFQGPLTSISTLKELHLRLTNVVKSLQNEINFYH